MGRRDAKRLQAANSADAAFPSALRTYPIDCEGQTLFTIAQSCKVTLDSLRMGEEGPDLHGVST